MSLHKAVWVTLCLLMLLILSSLCYFGTWKITIGGLADDFGKNLFSLLITRNSSSTKIVTTISS